MAGSEVHTPGTEEQDRVAGAEVHTPGTEEQGRVAGTSGEDLMTLPIPSVCKRSQAPSGRSLVDSSNCSDKDGNVCYAWRTAVLQGIYLHCGWTVPG